MKQLYPTNFTFTFRSLPLNRNTSLFLLIFLLNFTLGFGQNSVTINSAEENFTNVNPVPVEIIFEKGIDEIDPNDFQYINGDLINFERQDPEYSQSQEDLLIEKFNFSANAFELVLSPNPGNVLLDKLSKTVIAISQLNISELLFLKYGDGTDILNLNSGNRKETDIVAEDLSSPLDVEAYFNEMVYVADNEAQDIKVYDNVPQFVTAITPIDDDASEDLGPTSLVTDSDGNLYITVAHNGTNEYDNVDRVYIYDNNRNLTYEIEDGNNYELNSPYKIAVDNAGKLYVVDAGSSDSSNGRILIFEFNGTTYDLIETIEGAEDDLNSPGSIVVDDYGYIYVVDYLEQIVFNKIFEEPLSFILNYNEIKNSNFPVKVFDPNFNYVTEISGLNLPVDLELDHCGNLLVNNLEIQGDDIDEEDMIGPYPTSVNNDFEFTLKTFTRRDTFTADFEINQQCEVASFTIPDGLENKSNCSINPEAEETFSIILDENAPVVTTCYQENQTVEMGDKIPNYVEEGLVVFEDDCEGDLEIEQTPAPGTEISQQTTTVSITATDEAGNVSEACTFDLVVEEEEPDNPPQFTNCPQNIIEVGNDPGECGAILDFETPEATDDQVNPTVTQISGPVNGDFLSVEDGVVDLVFQADDGVNAPVNCTVQIQVVDTEKPVISDCPPENIEFTIQEGETYPLPDYKDQVTVEDNCETSLEPVQEPAPGTPIDDDQVVTLTVTDENGNEDVCTFTVEITKETPPDPTFDCPVEEDLDPIFYGENCSVSLPEYEISNPQNFESDQFLVQTFTENENSVSVNIEVYDGENGDLVDECSFDVDLVDNQGPVISNCPPENIAFTIQEGETHILDDYTNQVSTTDNCDNDPVISQQPTGGNEIKSDQEVILTATDDAGNESEICRFTVEITVEENNATAPQFDDCPTFIQRNVNTDECQARVDFDAPTASDDSGELAVSLVSNLGSGDLFPVGSTTVTYEATGENGETITCSFEVVIADNIAPELISCPDNIEIEIAADENSTPVTYTVPEFTDNCGVVDIQRNGPASGEDFPLGRTVVTYTAFDENDNEITCSFEVLVEREDDQSAQPSYECSQGDIPDLRLDENCEIAVIPDYSYLVETENFTPLFEQTEERFGETLVVNLEVINSENNSLVGECTFSINIVDLLPPNISCPGDQTENFDPETGFEVPDYENMATFSDNCGEVSFRQEPEAGEIIYEDTTVQLFAEDANEQVASCSFELQLTEANVLNIFCQIDQNVSPDEDCSFTLLDYTDTAEVSLPGATVTQSPPEGTLINENTQVKLTATLNGETDECFFMVNLVDNEDPVANCVSGYVVNLDESGNATLAPEVLDNNSTDNCGIVSMALSQTEFTRADIGEVPITLTVRDDAGNMDTCETTVEVVDEASGEFECRENVLVSLNENGEAVLSLQDLYTGNASGLTLEASRLNFSCSDLGVVQIQLDYSGAQTGSCTINVEVRDEIPPVINTDIVELTLDDQGFAYLEESDVLAENNCGQQLIYRFSKSVFNCEDVGSNTVNVEVEDANGNIAEKNIEVRINGEACEIPDNEDLEFLFIYPNPNNGIFTIATPEGMLVEQVRVFDSRGRFILQKEYKDIARFYRMTIEGVAASVYTLQIFTNEGVVVKRVIISR